MTYYGFFRIPGLPKTINSMGRSHWSVKAKEAKLWRFLVVMAVGKERPARPLDKAQVIFTRHSSTEPDADNLANCFKHVQDGLKDAKVIIDDKPSIVGTPQYKWERAKPKQGFITIEVRGME